MINNVDLNNYINKSRITKSALKEMHLNDFSVNEVKQAFCSIDGEFFKTGNEYSVFQQRRTKFVDKFELYRKVVKK